MANKEHLAILCQGVETWNEWRFAHEDVAPDLSGVDLSGVDLRGAYLAAAILVETNLTGADLAEAWLVQANLAAAILVETNLTRANLEGAYLSEAALTGPYRTGADLTDANLTEAWLAQANLTRANLTRANLTRAYLAEAILFGVDLSGAYLSGAYLSGANLVETIVERAHLSGAHVYGVAAWNLKGEPEDQEDLVITRGDEPAVTVDALEVAQFIHLMLNNEKLRRVIDTITSKVVLILGRFTPERKAVLDAVRTELRTRYNYSPVVFDFEKPASKTLTDTVRLLASMARFVIVDLSEATSANYELGVLSQLGLRRTPFVIMAETGLPTMAMLDDVLAMEEVIDDVHRYHDVPHLEATLVEAVIEPAEATWRDLNPQKTDQ